MSDHHRRWGRRAFLGVTGVALGGAALGGVLAACAGTGEPGPLPSPGATDPRSALVPRMTSPSPVPTRTHVPAIGVRRSPAPSGAFTALPGDGNLLAWTVDDGADSAVVRAYAQFAAATGTRLTLFVTASYAGWADNVDVLKPLIASGQVQLGNHTWSHPDLTSLSEQGVIGELQRAHDRIGELFGVDARPFYRPPYGFHNQRVRSAAASIGYTATTLWYGSLADSSLISAEEIVRLGNQWFLPQHIVIGHLNHPPVTTVFGQLSQIIKDHGLTTVTLNDVFTSPAHP